MKLKDFMPNNEINKILKPITNGFNIGANSATLSGVASKLYLSKTWRFGEILKNIVGVFF